MIDVLYIRTLLSAALTLIVAPGSLKFRMVSISVSDKGFSSSFDASFSLTYSPGRELSINALTIPVNSSKENPVKALNKSPGHKFIIFK